MRTTSRTLAPFIVLVAVSAAACDIQVSGHGLEVDFLGARASDVWTRTYTLPPSGHLEILNVNGGIEVEAGQGPQVQVWARRTARASSDERARELLGETQMAEAVSADRVRIESRPPRRSEGWFGRHPAGVTVEYLIRVPENLAMSFETTNGGIRLWNVKGDIAAATTNGGIRGERLSGSLAATAVNGGIRVDMAAVTGDIELSLTNGGIRLDLPRDTQASLDARCVNGGIAVDDDLNVLTTERSREHARFLPDRRRLAGVINGGGSRITASTVNGGIRIRRGPGQRS